MSYLSFKSAILLCTGLLTAFLLPAQDKPGTKLRARDLGVPFDGKPGPLNAITDVSGVTVGHTTLLSGEGKLQIGKGPVRTGVTRFFPVERKRCRSCLLRLVVAQRSGNDRHDLGRGLAFSRPGDDHQHT
jgi:hypothetical protein